MSILSDSNLLREILGFSKDEQSKFDDNTKGLVYEEPNDEVDEEVESLIRKKLERPTSLISREEHIIACAEKVLRRSICKEEFYFHTVEARKIMKLEKNEIVESLKYFAY